MSDRQGGEGGAETRAGHFGRRVELAKQGTADAPTNKLDRGEQYRAIGSRIGDYVIEDVVGAGGMGVVYAARDRKLGRKVAIKVLRRHNTVTDQELGARLVREARAMAKLSHPNVITVYGADTEDGEIYLVMEFVEGPTLAKWLEAPRRWREIVRTLIDAGRGLEAAHAVGLIHRDFKPENVMLDATGRARVTDFGIARNSDELEDDNSLPSIVVRAQRADLTGTGQAIGTPRYMSPEQYSADTIDTRSDQFSFCLVLYEAIYKQHPYAPGPKATDKTMEMLTRLARGQRSPTPKNVRVPRWLRTVLERGLATKPEDRFASMTELLEALERRHIDWRNFALVAVGLAAVGVGAQQLLASDSAAPPVAGACSDASSDLSGLWGPARKDDIAKAFQATRLGYADQGLQAVSRLVDGYAAELRTLTDEACRTRDGLAEARSRCLAERRHALGAALELFAHADAAVVEHAVDTVQALPDLRDCTNAERLTPPTPRPTKPALKAKVDEASDLAERAAIDLTSGHADDASALALKAVTAAREGSYAPVLADSLIALGRGHWQTANVEQARATFSEAETVSERARDDRAKARALIWLLVIDAHLDDYRSGEMFADMARASLERAGASTSALAGLLEFELGGLELRHGDANAALAHHLEALRLRKAALGPTHGDVAASMLALGACLQQLGRFDEALDYEQQAVNIIEATYGSEHPVAARALDAIGKAYAAKGDVARASAAYEDALHRLEHAVGHDHRDVAITLYFDLAKAAAAAHRPADARRYATTAAELDDQAGRANDAKAVRDWAAANAL